MLIRANHWGNKSLKKYQIAKGNKKVLKKSINKFFKILKLLIVYQKVVVDLKRVTIRKILINSQLQKVLEWKLM